MSTQIFKPSTLLSRLVVLLVLLLIIQLQAVVADAADPYRLMQQLAKRTFERLDREQHKIAQDGNHLRVIVQQELMPHVHVHYAGAVILGNAFKTLTSEQQQRYFQAFTGYLEQSYAQTLVFYQHQRYTIEPAKPLEGRNLVSIRVMLLQPGDPPLRVDFKWRKNSKNHQWQLYDIAVEGISIIVSTQQEWSKLLRESGIDGLIEQLQTAAKKPISLGKIQQ